MIILRPIFWFVILFLYKIARGVASDVKDTEHRQLERNLKNLRNDFNRIIETMEDFAGDFLLQMHDAGNLVESPYITDNDYNWQDDNSNTIEKTTKHSHFSLPTITETQKTILGKAPTLPKLHLPKIPNLITKNIEQQEVPNDIEKREKRSTHMVKEFENRPSAPMMVHDGQGPPPVQMPENFGQRSAEPVMPEFPPFTDKTVQIKENNREPEFYYDDNARPRSAAQIVLPDPPTFSDKTKHVRGDKKQEQFLEAKESSPEQSQTSTNFLLNQKSKDSIICAAKTQKEMDLENQKMAELREEVKKLNELVALLKDQQKIIKMFNDVDKGLETNEISDENIDNDIKNSFLYKTIKKLQNNRKNDDASPDKNGISDVKAKELKSVKPDAQMQNPGPTFEDLEKIKIDLRTTAENLNKTKAVLIREKKKEENLEQELKRQNSELKFLKVMTESLYDKMGDKSEDSKTGVLKHDYKLRASDFKDIDVDSLLEAVHIPKIMPTKRQKYSGEPALPKFYPSSNTRESNPGENRDSNMHKFLSILNNQENKSGRNQNNKNQNGEELNENGEGTFSENLQNIPNKDNNTFLPDNARASSSGKVDDIDLKLKLLEVLAKEGRSDDTSSKEKALNEAMKKLLAPEKKSDDDQLDAFLALFKEKSEPKSEKGVSQETIKKLFKELNAKPQSKSDDDVDTELRQLQKAINSLRPKEDPLLDNLDFGNNRRGKQDGGDIQSMLSQIIAQNGGSSGVSTGVDLAGAADVAVINANDGGSVSSASLDLPGVIPSNGGGKYTPQQILQLNKIMGTNNYNGGAGSSYSGTSNPAVQKLLSQYLASSNIAHQGSYGHGYPLYPNSPINYGSGAAGIYSGIGSNAYRPNSNAYSPNLNYGIGTNSYPSSSIAYRPHSNLYGESINSYGPNINPYGSDVHPYDANLYGANPNSYAYSFHPHGSNLYNPGPYLNPYSSSGGYGSSYGYDGSPSYESGLEEYGASPIYLSPNSGDYSSGNNYNSPYHSTSSGSYSGDAGLPHYTIPALSSYDVSAPNYSSSKNGYQPPSYTNIAPGVYPVGTKKPTNYLLNGQSGYIKNGYSGQGGIGSQNYGSGGYAGGNLGLTDYYNTPGYGKTGYGNAQGAISSQNYGSGGYSASGSSYQGSSNDYSGVTQGYKDGFGYTAEQNNADAYPSYGRQFFPSAGPAESIGATYQGNKYGSKSYGRPSLDKSYGNGQNSDQYKYALASDLAKQIESLESAITGLNKHDYSQTAADKDTVASLEQRIYELKGVISSLNKPPYSTQQSYQNAQLSYGSNSPEVPYSQSQGSYKQTEQPYAANHGTYGGVAQNGASSNTYGAPSHTLYQQSAIGGQTASNIPNHNSYVSYGSVPATQPSYSSTSPPQAPASQQYQENQASYTSNQPSSSNYSPGQPNQPKNSPLPYQASPPANTHSPVAYQSSPPQISPPYQPKRASGEDRRVSHGVRKELHRVRNAVEEKRRRKRQVDDMEASSSSPQIPQQVNPQTSLGVPSQAADMTINMRQNYGEEENRPVGYNFGDDALTQVANTFKKYLEETLTADENGNDPKPYQPVNNQESRNSAVTSLQEKLDFLKNQLESRQQSGRSLSNFYGPPGIPNYIPLAPVPTPYGNQNHFQPHSITSLEKTIIDKKQDIFTQIVLKILEKVLGALPSVLHRLFGNLVTTVGNSYGDNYSPLQTIFKNLGAIGYVPLILIKLLDTTGVIIQHLGKNKFFKNFLLPAGSVAVAGIFILFLINFYKQDEPYGYIGYQGSSKYPKYESSYYGHNNYGATDYDTYGNYDNHESYGNYGNSYDNHGKYRSNSGDYSSNPIHRPPLPYYIDGFYGDNMRQPLPGNNDGLYGESIRQSRSKYNNDFTESDKRQVPYGSNIRGKIIPYNSIDYDGRYTGSINEGRGPLRYSRGYYDYSQDRFTPSTRKNGNR